MVDGGTRQPPPSGPAAGVPASPPPRRRSDPANVVDRCAIALYNAGRSHKPFARDVTFDDLIPLMQHHYRTQARVAIAAIAPFLQGDQKTMTATAHQHGDLKIPTMKKVKSSNITAIGYDPEIFELHVQFANGSHYVHRSVSPDTHSAFMNTRSHGKFYAEHIRSKYAYYKLDQRS